MFITTHPELLLLMPWLSQAKMSTSRPQLDEVTSSTSSQSELQLNSQAAIFLEQLERGPSCNQLAGAMLIDSCKSLDPDQQANREFEKTTTVFAARLALCEISSAQVHIPAACSPMIPRPRDAPRKGLRCSLLGSCPQTQEDTLAATEGYNEPSEVQLGSCLTAFYGTDNAWTSYSNARQNAFAICRASRVEQDREDILRTHQNMASAVEMMGDKLFKLTQNADELAAMHERLHKASQNVHEKLVRDLETVKTHATEQASSWTTELQQQLASVFGNIFGALDDAGGKVGNLALQAAKVADDTATVRANVDGLWNDAIQGADSIHQSHDELKQSLEGIQTTEVSNLRTDIAETGLEMQSNRQEVEVMHAQIMQFGYVLQGVVVLLNDTRTALTDFQAQQHGQLENQSQALENINAELGNMQNSILEKTLAIQSIPSSLLGGFNNAIATLCQFFTVMIVAYANTKLGFGLAVFYSTVHALQTMPPLVSWVSTVRPQLSSLRLAMADSLSIVVPVFALMGVVLVFAYLFVAKMVVRKEVEQQQRARDVKGFV